MVDLIRNMQTDETSKKYSPSQLLILRSTNIVQN